MNLLDRKEMVEITGGASKGSLAVIISGIASFLIGIVGGFFQTKSCKLK